MKLPVIVALLALLTLLENVILFVMAEKANGVPSRMWSHAITAAIVAIAIYVLWTFEWARPQ
jgi:hypothetical protein